MKDFAYQHLLEIILETKNIDQLTQLFDAVLTEKEQKDLTNRIKIFAMLQDQKPQREISEELGVGIATVSRGAKAYRQLGINKLLPDLNTELEIKKNS